MDGLVVDTTDLIGCSARVRELTAGLEAVLSSRAALDDLAAETGSVRVHRASSLVTEGWCRVVDTALSDLEEAAHLLEAAAEVYRLTDDGAVAG